LRERESGLNYNAQSSFETFPFPWLPGKEPGIGQPGRDIYDRIAEAAKSLNEQRERWLNPPEWIEPIAAAVDAEDSFAEVPADARPLIRQSAIMARAAKDPNLKKRTLTNLYNQRPTWLKLAHEQLDRSVLAAYALVDPQGGWSEDWAAVWIDTGAGGRDQGSGVGGQGKGDRREREEDTGQQVGPCHPSPVRTASASERPPSEPGAHLSSVARSAKGEATGLSEQPLPSGRGSDMQSPTNELAERRRKVEEQVLANLLRLNLARAGT